MPSATLLPIRVLLLGLLSALALLSPASAQEQQQVPAASEPYVYEVDSLNAGLPALADPLELDTPQALLESFLDAGDRGEWERAATALDLADVPAGQQRERGVELAQQLYEIVHRSISVDWGSLPDRPDAVDTTTSDKDPMAGATRRSIALTRLEVGERTVPVRIARLQAGDSDPVWMFSRQTVENIPALYDNYGPNEFELSLPTVLRQQAFWTLAWWEVIALPIVLLLAIVAGGLTYLAFSRIGARFEEGGLWHGILRTIRIPAALLALAGTFAILRNLVFNFSTTITAFLNPLQISLIIIAIGAIALAVIEWVIDFATDRRSEMLESPDSEEERNFYTKMSAVRRIVLVVLILFGIGIVLVQTSITDSLGFSLLASAGVLGLVIAFAAREVLADLMASVQIAFAKTARIGDAVQYEGQWCYVERIGFTHLRLRTWDERRVMAPVGEFVGSSFENWTKQDPSLMMLVELQLDHRADVDALRDPFREFVEDADDIVDKDDAKIQVVGHDARAKTVRFLARAEDPKTGWDMHCRLREHMLAVAAKLDEAAGNEPAPAFLPREREVRMDVTADREDG